MVAEDKLAIDGGPPVISDPIPFGVSGPSVVDEEEVEAAEAAGIEAVLVPTEEGITDRLRNKWLDHNEEMKKARETTN